MRELITVKQLAEKLGVPKSKVSYQRRKLDDSLILQQNGTNHLTERAQLLITQAIHDLMNPPTAEDVEKKAAEEVDTDTETVESVESEQSEQSAQTKSSEQTEQTDETNETDSEKNDDEDEDQDSLSKETSKEMMDLLYERIDNLDDQIEVNQDQLKAKDEQIDKLTQLLNQSQQLQLQQQQQQLKLVEDIEFEKSLTWWQKLFGKK